MVDSIGILGFWTPGPLEIVIIGVVAVLIFGKRLPEIARGMGKSVSEFKKGIKEAKDTQDEVIDEVTRVGRDVADEAKKASGLDDLDDDKKDDLDDDTN